MLYEDEEKQKDEQSAEEKKKIGEGAGEGTTDDSGDGGE